MARALTAPRSAAVLVAVVVATGLTGCSATNTITTQVSYNPSDGVAAEVGHVRAGNVLILAAEQGAPGTVLGYLVNDGTGDVQVRLAVDGEQVLEDALPAGGTMLLGPDHTDVAVDRVPVAPGGLVPVTLSSAAGNVTVSVPVLDATLPQYADVIPAPEDPPED